MTHEMQMMAKKFIKKDFSIKEILEIMRPLARVLQDRKNIERNIQKRKFEDDANEIEKIERMICFFKEAENEDFEEAEAVLRKYELDYDVDELLGTEQW